MTGRAGFAAPSACGQRERIRGKDERRQRPVALAVNGLAAIQEPQRPYLAVGGPEPYCVAGFVECNAPGGNFRIDRE